MPSAPKPRFTPATFRFLRELAKNNDRTWFQANKARYEADVLNPAVQFVAEMAPGLSKISRQIVADARPYGGSVSRIYRDTRFAKDKTPYHTHLGIMFSHADGATSEEHLPGFYLHIAPGASMLYSGSWHPSPPALAKIRSAIAADGSSWKRLPKVARPSEGDTYAKVPSGFPPDHPYADDLRRKDFFAGLSFPDKVVTSAGFGKTFLASCRKLDPLNQFLADALSIDW